jgi:hypothetical protein
MSSVIELLSAGAAESASTVTKESLAEEKLGENVESTLPKEQVTLSKERDGRDESESPTEQKEKKKHDKLDSPKERRKVKSPKGAPKEESELPSVSTQVVVSAAMESELQAMLAEEESSMPKEKKEKRKKKHHRSSSSSSTDYSSSLELASVVEGEEEKEEEVSPRQKAPLHPPILKTITLVAAPTSPPSPAAKVASPTERPVSKVQQGALPSMSPPNRPPSAPASTGGPTNITSGTGSGRPNRLHLQTAGPPTAVRSSAPPILSPSGIYHLLVFFLSLLACALSHSLISPQGNSDRCPALPAPRHATSHRLKTTSTRPHYQGSVHRRPVKVL